MPTESALVVLIPEAEDLVSSFRHQFDPAAAAGVPAHVTIVYPFKPPVDLSAGVIERLRQIFATIPSFELHFERLERFPTVLYLKPEPDEILKRLTKMIADCFPEAPPYGGAFKDIVPHLTIAHSADARQLEVIAAEFARQAQTRLPIQSRVSAIALMENESSRWQLRCRFPLANV